MRYTILLQCLLLLYPILGDSSGAPDPSVVQGNPKGESANGSLAKRKEEAEEALALNAAAISSIEQKRRQMRNIAKDINRKVKPSLESRV